MDTQFPEKTRFSYPPAPRPGNPGHAGGYKMAAKYEVGVSTSAGPDLRPNRGAALATLSTPPRPLGNQYLWHRHRARIVREHEGPCVQGQAADGRFVRG